MPVDSGLLRGLDRAGFAVAFAARLRRAGVPVGLTGMDDFVRALAVSPPMVLADLYWTARISLVRRPEEIAAFDAVFHGVRAAVEAGPRRRGRRDERNAPVPAGSADREEGGGLPWVTLPPVVDTAEDAASGLSTPQRLPSAVEALADRPFEDLDNAEVRLLGEWLRATMRRWPTRRTRRAATDPAGHRIAVRPTIAGARRTGWEPIRLVHVRPVRKPRRVVLLCDVSQSMQAQMPAYLELMRALSGVADAHPFAFATRLSKFGHGSVADRYGGTRIAANLRTLLHEHGGLLRGAVVLIASDGWDSDPPADLAAAMVRLRRHAFQVIWLNPRAGAAGFQPRVAAMAAALPHCDAMLPADSFRSLRAALDTIARLPSAGLSSTASRGWTA